jgi:hypothetical protein
MEGCGNRVSCEIKNFAFDITISVILINVRSSKRKPFLDKHGVSQYCHLTISQKGAYYSGIKIFNL